MMFEFLGIIVVSVLVGIGCGYIVSELWKV